MTVEQLKREARRHYERYQREVAASSASCGLNLLAAINPRVYQHAWAFNRVMDQLAKLDPQAPATRLPEGT